MQPIHSGIDLIDRLPAWQNRTAIVDAEGEHTYAELATYSGSGAHLLLKGKKDLHEARVAFMMTPGFSYAAVQWSIWRAGGVAVPLSLHHPLPELVYVLDDTGAEIIVVDEAYAEVLAEAAEARGIRMIIWQHIDQHDRAMPLPLISLDRRAMILYTSGTTSKPKGVVSTHANIASQADCLIEAWSWRREDQILHVLPLHHTHGIVNVLLCALGSGAVCHMLPGFDARAVWEAFVARPLTLFMAVPTIYARLISHWKQANDSDKERWSDACLKLRLMVSGSAALPVTMLEAWREISGHTLLERYGMTEIGMALTNPLIGERRPGAVGMPVPGMQVKLVDEDEQEVVEEEVQGEIRVKGPNVFSEYWNRPEATAAAFKEGWFCTGDVAVLENGYYRILGRNAVDIIKTGGYKVSALEIEEVLRTHPAIRECAVVGVVDEEWGERVCAGLVLETGEVLTLKALRAWSKERLAPYKIPTRMTLLADLPRNALGKVTKPALKPLFS